MAALRGYEPRGSRTNIGGRHVLTVQHLRTLKHRLPALLSSTWDQRCVWAACTLGFYGAFRSSEYLATAPGRGALRTDVELSPSCCRFRIGIQKNRQRGPAAHVELPATGTATCPGRAMWFYCQARDTDRTAAMPLFLLESGAPLTRRRLNGVLRDALGEGFSSHSLRIGLATSAAAAGVPDDVIQRLSARLKNKLLCP